MSVRTKELGNAALVTVNAWVEVYEVPAGATAIVKEIAHYALTAVPVQLRVQRGADTRVVGSGSNAANTVLVVGRWLVLEAGDVLEAARTGGTNPADLWVSGTQLDGVAP